MVRCCDLVRINGVLCHESGCTNKNYNFSSGNYTHKCFECGCEVESDSRTRYECDCMYSVQEPEEYYND